MISRNSMHRVPDLNNGHDAESVSANSSDFNEHAGDAGPKNGGSIRNQHQHHTCPTCSNRISLSQTRLTELLFGNIILVVDDCYANRYTLRRVLQSSGAEIKEACDGQEAIQALENERFDLILMDVSMPKMDGCRTARIIRSGAPFKKFKAFKTIPIIAVTASDNEDEVFDSGMNAHFYSPEMKYAELKRVVFELINE